MTYNNASPQSLYVFRSLVPGKLGYRRVTGKL